MTGALWLITNTGSEYRVEHDPHDIHVQVVQPTATDDTDEDWFSYSHDGMEWSAGDEDEDEDEDEDGHRVDDNATTHVPLDPVIFPKLSTNDTSSCIFSVKCLENDK